MQFKGKEQNRALHRYCIVELVRPGRPLIYINLIRENCYKPGRNSACFVYPGGIVSTWNSVFVYDTRRFSFVAFVIGRNEDELFPTVLTKCDTNNNCFIFETAGKKCWGQPKFFGNY